MTFKDQVLFHLFFFFNHFLCLDIVVVPMCFGVFVFLFADLPCSEHLCSPLSVDPQTRFLEAGVTLFKVLIHTAK